MKYFFITSILGVGKCYKIQKDLNTTTRTDFTCVWIIMRETAHYLTFKRSQRSAQKLSQINLTLNNEKQHIQHLKGLQRSAPFHILAAALGREIVLT